MTRPHLLVLLGGAVLAAALLVLVPDDNVPSSVVWRFSLLLRDAGAPAWLWSYDVWEFVANIALFVPLGVLGALLRPRWPLWLWTALALVASGTLELVQAAFLPGRTPTPHDVLANSLGLLGGVVGAHLVGRMSRRKAPSAAAPASR